MDTPSESTKRRVSWRALLLLAVVFVLGFGIGAGGVLVIGRHMLRKALTASASENGPIDRLLDGTERSLARRLSLTPEERAAVHEELTTTGREFKRDRASFVGSLRRMTADTIARIAKRLSPDKGARLRKLAREHFEPLGLLPESSPATTP
jgi:hypothetical protein